MIFSKVRPHRPSSPLQPEAQALVANSTSAPKCSSAYLLGPPTPTLIGLQLRFSRRLQLVEVERPLSLAGHPQGLKNAPVQLASSTVP